MEQARLADKPFLAIERHYAVAPEKLWRAWTTPEAIARWWGPGANDPVSLAQMDVRVGGRFRIVFGGPQGRDNEVQGVYQEVVPNRRLVFTWSWPNSTPDRVSLVSLTFSAADGGTDFHFLHEQFFDQAARDGHERGWGASFARLDAYLGQSS